LILGLNAFHGDAAACVVRDGVLVAAAEEERFRRLKHWAGFPSEAIRYCLQAAGCSIQDVAHIAINQDQQANLLRKMAFVVANRPSLSMLADRLRNKRERASIKELLAKTFDGTFSGRIHFIEHHLAHLASAYYVSPFREAAVVSVDGFGDFASAAWGFGNGDSLRLDSKVYFPHSLGIFYQALTQYLGFPHYGDEYKVMGLAAYGKTQFVEKMERIVRLLPDGTFELDLRYFRHAAEKIEYEWDGGEPAVGRLFTPALEDLLGPARGAEEPLTPRHHDLAASAQAMYEKAFFHLLNTVQRQYATDALALAGGCAMNSVANGKVYQSTRFKHLYVQSAAGDAGGAIGAAFAAWHEIAERGRASNGRFAMDHAYWGPSYSDEQIHGILDAARQRIDAAGCRLERVDDERTLVESTARAIAAGQVIGWFQGRMEWGPRALGNRSILGDPRRADMKDILNLKIKRRESFRPFAPSILRRAVQEWFETDDDVPFMMQVFTIRPQKRAAIPAVTHVDGTGRLQTVDHETNARYHRLIEAFEKQTGIPMLLNTSFNENEPVVCRPEEALDCFLRTKMDVLVLGNWQISRQAEDSQP